MKTHSLQYKPGILILALIFSPLSTHADFSRLRRLAKPPTTKKTTTASLLALSPSSIHADSVGLRRLGKPAPPPPSPPTTSSPTAPVVWGQCQSGGQSCTKDSDCGICAGGTNAGASCTSNANCKRSTCTVTTGSCSFTTNAPTKAPITSAPVTSAPVTSAPVTSAPVTSAPVTSAPVTSAPVTSAPVTSAPVTAAPSTTSPTSVSPVSGSPTSAAPTSANPTSASPTSAAPFSASPNSSAPTLAIPACVNDDFSSLQNGWNGAVVSYGGESFLAVTQRAGRWVGPKKLLPMNCIVPAKYSISARIRLKHNSTGGVSNCTKGVLSYCPDLTMSFQRTNVSSWEYHSVIGSTLVGADNTWITMSTVLNFYRDYPTISTMYMGPYLYFQGPEIEVDIHLDDFVLQQLPELDFGIIKPEHSSENVILPDPPQPSIVSLQKGVFRKNCPHQATGLLNWHDAGTWPNGVVPLPGDNVSIPSGLSVLVDQSVNGTLGTVVIPNSSSLIIGEHSNGIEIRANGFDVRGSLIAGSETCRIETSITLTLHGDRPDDRDINGTSAIATATYKGIAVNGGTLSLHGKRFYRTWTRLAKTVRPGDSILQTQHLINWEVGQQIVIVTTALRDDRAWHQNEIRSVVSVVPDPQGVGSIIALDSPVLFKHIANFAYQGEVGLLSRTIKVQGSETSQPESDIDYGNYTSTRWVMGNYLAPNPTKNLRGFGGHIIIRGGGLGFVEGVELYRMGQTNFLGRYPMHFHLLGNGCPGCYFRDSSVHKSFYRCVSIHGTHNLTVTENVAYDITGYCYYLEDGVEQDNTISFNLGSHIHFLGEAPYGDGQQVKAVNVQSIDRILPADSTSSAFYITNMHNDIIGNVASGGWAGFAFPILREPLGPSRSTNMRPSAQLSKTIDGNTAHSTGWFWEHASGFYLGGSLFYRSDNLLVYDAGRGQDSTTPKNARERWPCLVDKCATGNCDTWCQESEWAWNRITNSKAYAIAGAGMNSWTGRIEVLSIETHDVGLSLEALEAGVWIDRLLATCRTGEDLAMPREAVASYVRGSGFVWYDTGQEHIMSNATFRNCGFRTSAQNPFNQYDSSLTRGCDSDRYVGCDSGATVFGLLTHSDQFNPEIMQVTSNIVFDNCGRRFKLTRPEPSSVSGRIQNWLDADGSLMGLDEPLIAGSGLPDAASWWEVEDQVIKDSHGPLTFIRQNRGPARGLGHIHLEWDAALYASVGVSVCGNGDLTKTCPAVGYIKHMGTRFDGNPGLSVTANADIAGPVGGFGWLLSLNGGAPKALDISNIEVFGHTPLLISIQYPVGTEVSVTFSYPQISRAAVWSRPSSCKSAAHYYDISTGLLTVRVVGTESFFSRANLTLPRGGNLLKIRANCASNDGIYCSSTINPISSNALNLCPVGYSQVAYDTCCSLTNSSMCEDVKSIYGVTSTPSPAGTNLVSDPSFEGECKSGSRSWYAGGSETVLQIDQSNYSNGTQSMKVLNRKSSYNGVQQDMTGIFLPGNTYQITYCARFLSTTASIALKLSILLSTGSYSYVGYDFAISTDWRCISRQYTIPQGAVKVVLYVESIGTTANVTTGFHPDYAVDGFDAYKV